MNQELQDKLKEIIKPYVQDMSAFNSLSPQTNFLQDLKINSAHLIDIILDIEEAFDIEISDEAVEKMNTVEDAMQTISSCLNQ